ncbi:tyrosine-protein phosphatase [Jiella sp. MQZ9-1]|uniref:Tyrosine-protein phosphatase n=1 Tax=Jiella flava TaxID=2816857 RepID=A0A939FYU1_9HYPH|nr:tyrosine-protein phosphatase [Jiella flava]MBO0662726.1 tyrosine-protein phosphatase [Jiella flava]MCD2471148.1 tyrosine-protein phosphatase [Jiella flava]
MKLVRNLAAMALGIVAVLTGLVLANALYIHLSGNIHTVEAGRLYRSGTLSPDSLQTLIREKGIRTIVNLRGDEGQEWWNRERDVAAKNGVDFLSFHLSAKDIPTMRRMNEIAFVLRNAPEPILVHCNSGADRSGLVSALFEYVVSGKSAATSDRQLSILYGHFPWLGSRTVAMDEAFADYVADHQKHGREPVQVPGASSRRKIAAN